MSTELSSELPTDTSTESSNPRGSERIDSHHHLWDLGVRPQGWTADFPVIARTFTLAELEPELSVLAGDRTSGYGECQRDDDNHHAWHDHDVRRCADGPLAGVDHVPPV